MALNLARLGDAQGLRVKLGRTGALLNLPSICAIGLIIAMLCLRAVSSLAQDVPNNYTAQQQVDQALAAIRNSEAETSAGSYVPGSGAFFAIDLVHGPNSNDSDTPYRAVRDWTIYLISTFGLTLTAVPDNEVIAFTVRYFDYIDSTFHSLTISAPARSVTIVEDYAIWLDGVAYNEDDARSAEAANGGDVPTPVPTSSTILVFETTPTPEPPPIEPAVPTLSTPGAATPTTIELPLETIAFATADSIDSWQEVGGTWGWNNGAYEQTALNRFDLISYFASPIAGLTQMSVDLQFIDGQMGSGLVFAAPDMNSKNGAQMVSFAANGTFLQWGYYDDVGVFQYVGGVQLETSTADGKWHTLAVSIDGNTFAVSIDGVMVGDGIPLQHGADGYIGLLASTADTKFDNIAIEAGS